MSLFKPPLETHDDQDAVTEVSDSGSSDIELGLISPREDNPMLPRNGESRSVSGSIGITLRVKTPSSRQYHGDSRIIQANVHPRSTISDLKRRFLLGEMQQYRRVVLSYKSRELEPTQALLEMDVGEGSVLDVLLLDRRQRDIKTWDIGSESTSHDSSALPNLEGAMVDAEDDHIEMKQNLNIAKERILEHRSHLSIPSSMTPAHVASQEELGYEYPQNPQPLTSCDTESESEAGVRVEMHGATPQASPTRNSLPCRDVSQRHQEQLILVTVMALLTGSWGKMLQFLSFLYLGVAAAMNQSIAVARRLGAIILQSCRRGCHCLTHFTTNLVSAWSNPAMGPDYAFFIGVFIGVNPNPGLLYVALRLEVPKLCIGMFFGLGLRMLRWLILSTSLRYPGGVDPNVGRPLTIELLEGLRRGRKLLASQGTDPQNGILIPALIDTFQNSTQTGSTIHFELPTRNVTHDLGSNPVANNTTITNNPPLVVLTPPPLSPVYAFAGQRLLKLIAEHGSNALAWIRDPLPPYFTSVDKNFVPPESEASQSFPILLN